MRWYRRVLIMVLVLITILETGFSLEKISLEYEEKQVSVENVSKTMVILGGMPVGIYMKTDGILVLGTEGIESLEGVECEPAKNIVKPGDYIVEMNGKEVTTKNDLVNCVERLEEAETILKVRREGEEIQLKLKAIQVAEEDYKLGIWVKDSLQGLGTITYLEKDGSFGALGHGIYDSENSELVEMKDGRLYCTKLLGIKKGEKGTPGGIEGVIVYNTRNYLGDIDKNTEIGIYGTVEELGNVVEIRKEIAVANKKEIQLGDATICCTIEDRVEEYKIEIEQIDYYPREANKGMVIRITDKRLLEKTGGIVQGMSGSPVIQNGRIVGAVTHVLVNDPTRGYGIFIENMLKEAD